MQWNDSPHAGFSHVEPWLPVADDYRAVNVAVEREQHTSVLSLIRCLIEIRRAHPALATGSYCSLDAGDPDVLAYLREADGERIAIALNFGGEPRQVNLGTAAPNGHILCSTLLDREGTVDLATLDLRQGEGLVVQLA
jgi:alpha-glucosidase